MKSILLIVLIINFFSLQLLSADWLVLESTDGRSLQARITGFEDDSVHIITSQRQRFLVPMDRFNEATQRKINSERKRVEEMDKKIDNLLTKFTSDFNAPFRYRVEHLPRFSDYFTDRPPASINFARYRAYRAARAQHEQRREAFAHRYELFIVETWPGVTVTRGTSTGFQYIYQDPTPEIRGQLEMSSQKLLDLLTDTRSTHTENLRQWVQVDPAPIVHMKKLITDLEKNLAPYVEASDRAATTTESIQGFSQSWERYKNRPLSGVNLVNKQRSLRRQLESLEISF